MSGSSKLLVDITQSVIDLVYEKAQEHNLKTGDVAVILLRATSAWMARNSTPVEWGHARHAVPPAILRMMDEDRAAFTDSGVFASDAANTADRAFQKIVENQRGDAA
jgi:hypothetical protein